MKIWHKNDRIDKNMDHPAKIYQREYNGRLAQDEAQAIHTYLGADMRYYINYLNGKINDVCLTIFGFVCPKLMGSIYF